MNEPTTVLCRAGKHTMGFNPGQSRLGLAEMCIILREDELVHESCTWEKTAAHLALALHDLDIAAERISTLEAENKRLRYRLCIYCRFGYPVIKGRHKVVSLSECEPNQFVDGRSEVIEWVLCPCEHDRPGEYDAAQAAKEKP